jgi:hypothetical protein
MIIMLNVNIIDSTCKYLSISDIIHLYETTKFDPDLPLWKTRIVECDNLTKKSLYAVVSFFPVICLKFHLSSLDSFYDPNTQIPQDLYEFILCTSNRWNLDRILMIEFIRIESEVFRNLIVSCDGIILQKLLSHPIQITKFETIFHWRVYSTEIRDFVSKIKKK